MCRRIECSQCHKPSWAGCGAHVEQVLGDVPQKDRCQCKAKQTQAANSNHSVSIFSQLINKWRGQ